MPLKPQVFPREDVDPAGMLEKENRATRAALQAASFVEGLSLFENRQFTYSSTGLYVLAEGTITARAGQWIQLFGNVVWTGDTAAAGVNIGVYFDDNVQPSLNLAAAQKDTTAATEVVTAPLSCVLQAPRARAKVAIKATVLLGGTGAFSTVTLGYYRFSGGPT